VVVKKDSEKMEDKKKNPWLLTVLEITGLVFIGLQTFISLKQCSISETQANIQKEQSKQSDKIEVTRAVQAESLLAFSRRQSAATESLFHAAQISANASRELAAITNRVHESMDRPYLTFNNFQDSLDTSSGKLFARMSVTNTGKSPAKNMRLGVLMSAVEFKEKINKHPNIQSRDTSNLTVGAGVTVSSTWAMLQLPISYSKYMALVKDRKYKLVVVGVSTYQGYSTDSVYNEQYCQIYSPESGGYYHCK
jgi:hypothetical protein